MIQDEEPMSDRELDILLSHASDPRLPLGARSRLQTRLDRESMKAGEGPLPVPEPRRSRLGWLAGLPLAASLAFGIYLGNAGALESILPSAAYELLAGVNIDDPVSGIEDVESLSEDELS